jgi:hypothetical protein
MKNLIRLGKELVGNSEILFPIFVPRFRKATISNKSDICIAGPPRSANTYAVNVFQIWNPDTQIAHHVHLPMQVIYAVKWNIPCIVPLRNPLDVVASEIIVDPKLFLTIALWSYINFYNRIRVRREKIVIALFDEIVNNFHTVIHKVNTKYGTDFYAEKLDEHIEKKIRNQIRGNRKINAKYPLLVAVPEPAKERRKAVVKESICKHPLFSKACEVYDEWVNYSDRLISN